MQAYAAPNCDGLAGEIVACKAVEEFFFGEVIFVELRGKLYKIVIDIGARQRCVIGVGEESVESVAKLMQESLDFVWSEKRRFVGRRFGEIHHD